MHVEGGQTQGQFRLQLWGESLLVDVIAALQVQVVKGMQIPLRQFRGRDGHEGDAE